MVAPHEHARANSRDPDRSDLEPWPSDPRPPGSPEPDLDHVLRLLSGMDMGRPGRDPMNEEQGLAQEAPGGREEVSPDSRRRGSKGGRTT